MSNLNVCVLIAYIGKLPDWFEIWRFAAKKNSKVDFVLVQDQLPAHSDANIRFINLSLGEINMLPKMVDNQLRCSHPYKLCDYKPLYGYLFDEYIHKYDYWGFGDIDVLYGDIAGILGSKFGSFDYISTGWNGESGPLAFIKNTKKMNSLWRKIPQVVEILNSSSSFAMDEKHFLELLSKSCKCDIEFRECLNDLPAIWKNGHITSLRSSKEYVLYHFGGRISGSQKQICKHSSNLLRQMESENTLIIKNNFKISKYSKWSSLDLIFSFYGRLLRRGKNYSTRE